MGRNRRSSSGDYWARRDRGMEAMQRSNNEDRSNWSEPYGGGDADGNPLTASFGSGRSDGHTLLGDGDRSESNFLSSDNHNHYGSGNGPHDNVKDRDQYHGRGY
jgi:hypothetical protein